MPRPLPPGPPDATPVPDAATLPRGRVGPIVMHPDPRLRVRAEPAGYLTRAEIALLAADMLATMYDAGGRGLAGPQFGVLRRLFVMDAGWKVGAPQPLLMLDPEILWRSDEVARAQESCLSIPGQPVVVERPVSILLAWYDLDGLRRTRQMDGVEARIAQHELDHLDGRLIIDAPDAAAETPAAGSPADAAAEAAAEAEIEAAAEVAAPAPVRPAP